LWNSLLEKKLVLHSGHQDLEIFFFHTGRLPAQIFDTQLAAIPLKQGLNVSYSRLVENFTGIELDKSHSLTDWSQRPLSQDQIRYAKDDVRYLAQIYPMMLTQLGEKASWLETDFYPYTQTRHFTPNPETLWTKLRNAMMLKPQQRTLAFHICQWREEVAKDLNLPRRHALSDEQVTELTRHPPRSLGSLNGLRNLPAHLSAEQKTKLHEAIIQGLAMSADDLPQFEFKPKLNDEEKRWIKHCQDFLTQQAEVFHILANHLVSQRDLIDFLKAPEQSRLMAGWRYWVIGQPLGEYLRLNPIQSLSPDLAQEFRA
jgi:ribonuclease D